MFYLSRQGWHYYSIKDRSWNSTGSHLFNEQLSKNVAAEQLVDLKHGVQIPDDALPPFSGSKILCVGRNYRKHAAELGNDVPERPLWFSKPPSSIIGEGGTVKIPANAGRIDYEGELALLIGRRASNVSHDEALACIGGVTASLDMTARDLQKSDGQWTRAKGFDTFLPLASLVAPFTSAWSSGSISVRKNDLIVQQSDFSAMVFGFATLIADISACMTLEPGDIILTGTPEGIGPVTDGDRLQVEISGPVKIVLNVKVSR
ncbi:MAG TPA: fumarylacetoacetate hydrolase family protein [Candidatus Rifleibacterium sp.]|nr:fumarylacetoacetate hydrolase family protein [Candidatus Rifleibacterium sp.]HPT44807.1 fumarylacetoacetate hydrolase family protein [Candidatus Rifleibacterium sp.]